MFERLHSHWSVLHLHLSDLLVYLVSMSPPNEFSIAICYHQGDHQMTAKPKMATRKLQILEKREIRKTTGQAHIGCAVDWQDLR